MWTTVHREISPWDAHIVAGMLQAEGLTPFLHSVQHVGAYWPMSLMLGMVRVQVPLAEAEAARAVLQAWREGEFDAALSAEQALPGDVYCPRCAIYRWRWGRDGWASALATLCWGFGCVFPPPPTGRRCTHCGLRQTLAEMDEGTPA
ncbi:DUF2007 domain-containing protein [Ottowia sp. GY511]|uniref:DUF2007 domain-containing protein n=1 Tax=Ottowia flava TaxID=2675430 RepID=A0ABW4KVD7_9BURK|nr:DUF2007 domain-containing protein [Ottowia sp. GY511]TXK31390.1 DUF2007 domain-containing protein [Ottowia sp. GY511]